MMNKKSKILFNIFLVFTFIITACMSFGITPKTITVNAESRIIEWTRDDILSLSEDESVYDYFSNTVKGITLTIHSGSFNLHRDEDYCEFFGYSDEKSFTFSIENDAFAKIEFVGDWVNGYPAGEGWNEDTYTWTGESSEVILNGDASYINWIRFTLAPRSYTVTLETNGGTINSGNVTKYYEEVGATLPDDVTKDDYAFGGWYSQSNLSGDRVYSIPTDATGNKTYWAKWDELPSITALTVLGYDGYFDGESHGATISGDTTGYTIKFSTDGENFDLDESPVYNNVSTNTVYYKITKEGYKKLTGEVKIILKPAYYIVGTFTDWNIDTNYMMKRNIMVEAEEYFIDVTLDTTSQFKVKGSDGLFPTGTENSYGEHGEITEVGDYRVFFRPGQDCDDWFEHTLKVEKRPFVAQIGETTYTSLADAYSHVSKGDTIKLINDVDLRIEGKDYLIITKNVTINLNGHILNINSNSLTDYIVSLGGGAVITIDNSEESVGGILGVCGVTDISDAHILFKNCRLMFTVEQVLASADVNRFDKYHLVENINDNGEPDENGFITLIREMTDQEKVNRVESFIDDISEVVYTAECYAKITLAQTEYNELNDDQKALVTNYNVLTIANKDYAEAKEIGDTEAANAVIELINNLPLPEDMVRQDKYAVNDAKSAYEALIDDQKAKISAETVQKLDDALLAISALDAKYDVELEDCTHNLIEISKVTKSTDALKIYTDYHNDNVARNSTGVKVNFPKASNRKITPGNTIVTVTVNLPEAMEIDIFWRFEFQNGYHTATVTITHNNEEVGSYNLKETYQDSWVTDHISCNAGVNTFTYKCQIGTTSWAEVDQGRNFYVIPMYLSTFDEDDFCHLCGAYCEFNPVLAYDKVAEEYHIECDGICGKTYSFEDIADDYDAVVSVIDSYVNLSAEEQEKVPAELKNSILMAKQDIEDTAIANETTVIINALPEIITLENKFDVVTAREAYDALTDNQKAKVLPETLAKLTAAETTIENIEASNAVKDLINLIGEVTYSEESRQAIEQAREAYNNLTDDQKALVGDITVLTDAEDEFAQMATNEISNLIDVEEVTLDNKDDIISAKEAYDALTPEEQANIPAEIVEKLESAIKEIEDIETAEEAQEIINDLPDVEDITLENKDDVMEAKEAYDALSPEAKAKVSAEVVERLELAVKEINDIETSNEAQETINDLPEIENITLEDKDAVVNARTQYEALSPEAKAKVPAQVLEKLASAEQEIADAETADITEQAINTLPEEITLDNKLTVMILRQAYENLTDNQKAKVSPEILEKLISAETTIENIETSNAVRELIDLIGQVEYNEESREAIEQAREAYNNLTDDQKALVGDIAVLTDAEDEYAQLATTEINNLIDVDEVTLDNKDDIISAKEAYDALTPEEQANIPAEIVEKLNSAVKEINDIETSDEAKEVINELPVVEEITLDNKDDIISAREAYEALSPEAKAKVPAEIVEKLASAEQEIVDIETSDDAKETISELPDVTNVTLENKDAVMEAREAYDALTDYQKSKIPAEIVEKLVSAEQEIVDIETSDDAKETISNLPDVDNVTLENKDAVTQAREAYDALTDYQKSKVPAQVVEKLVAVEKEIVDTETAKETTEDIGALPDIQAITVDDKDDIISAKEKYDALTPDQKAKVSDEVVAKLNLAVNDVLSKEVISVINSIDAENPDEEKTALARELYNSLTPEQQALVSNYNSLTVSENTVSEIKEIAVSEGEGNVVTYAKEIDKNTAETGVNVKELFKQASKNNSEDKEVAIKAGETTVVFDSNAVSDIGDKATTFAVKVSTEAPKGAKMQIDIDLSGATFASGKAKVSTAYTEKVSFGKKLVVYWLNEQGKKVAMKTSYENGVVTFETNHFSTYIVEEKANALMVTGIVLGGLVVIAAVALLLIKLNVFNKPAKATLNNTTINEDESVKLRRSIYEDETTSVDEEDNDTSSDEETLSEEQNETYSYDDEE